MAGCVSMAANATTITVNGTGTDGLFWSYWHSGGGTASLTLNGGGAFASSWGSVGDVTMGKGWNPGSARQCGYNAGYYSNNGGGTAGMYGWTDNAQTEWYVNEFWHSNPQGSGTKFASLSSDGGSYNCYRLLLTGSSPKGSIQFWQLNSTRTAMNTTGANHGINTGNHFYAWKSGGTAIGSTFRMMFFSTEGWGGSGGANVSVW